MFHMATLKQVGGVESCPSGQLWSLATTAPSVVTTWHLDDGIRLYCSPRDGGLFYASTDIRKTMHKTQLLPQERATLVWHIYQRNRLWFEAMLVRSRAAPDTYAVNVLQKPHQFLEYLPVLTPDWIQDHRHRSPSREELLTAFMGEIIHQKERFSASRKSGNWNWLRP